MMIVVVTIVHIINCNRADFSLFTIRVTVHSVLFITNNTLNVK